MWSRPKNKKKHSTTSKLEISAPITEPTHVGASTGGGINLDNISKVPTPSGRATNSFYGNQNVAPVPRQSPNMAQGRRHTAASLSQYSMREIFKVQNVIKFSKILK